ncbi:MAG: RNA polymerase sigma factor [Planctomycetota bacterium]
MAQRVSSRSNEEWLKALRSNDTESHRALDELRDFLQAMVRRVLGGRGDDLDLDDVVQDALVRLIQSEHTFRGDSAFTTWAASVATRVAFTALRKRIAGERGQRGFRELREQALRVREHGAEETHTAQEELVNALNEAIDAELTDRQRVAILAELRGVPTVEIARQLGTNQNALYKLTHDARKRIRTALQRRGFTAAAMEDCVRGATY